MSKGMFITFEGNDGSGKTTISLMVFEEMKRLGYPVIYTREPGGIDIAEQIRSVILDPENTKMDGRTEALLYAASRRQHLIEKVLPALADKKIVLCDRFIDSSLAYQGVARGIGVDEVYQINEFAIEGHMPDATIFLDVSLEKGMERIATRGEKDRLDNEKAEFHELVSKGYEYVKETFQERMCIIDANQNIEDVYNNTLKAVLNIVENHV